MNNKLKILCIIIITISICIISVGYAAYNTDLTISGDAIIEVESNIRITEVKLMNTNNAYEVYNSEYTDDTISFYPHLNATTSTIAYEVTLTNSSNYDIVLHDVYEIVVTNRNLSFRFDDLTYPATIKAHTSVTFHITISSLANAQQGNLEIQLIYTDNSDFPQVQTFLTGAKSTTSSYVKTGIYPSSETRATVDFTIVEPRSTSVWLFSSRRAYKNQMFGIAYGSYNGAASTQESLLQFNDVSYNLGKTGFGQNIRHSADISKEGLYLDGRNYADPADTFWESIFELYMFANNEARNVKGFTNGQVVIHEVKIYQDGQLVLDAVPVILTTGEAAYWNKVTNLPLTNVGTVIAIYG